MEPGEEGCQQSSWQLGGRFGSSSCYQWSACQVALVGIFARLLLGISNYSFEPENRCCIVLKVSVCRVLAVFTNQGVIRNFSGLLFHLPLG